MSSQELWRDSVCPGDDPRGQPTERPWKALVEQKLPNLGRLLTEEHPKISSGSVLEVGIVQENPNFRQITISIVAKIARKGNFVVLGLGVNQRFLVSKKLGYVWFYRIIHVLNGHEAYHGMTISLICMSSLIWALPTLLQQEQSIQINRQTIRIAAWHVIFSGSEFRKIKLCIQRIVKSRKIKAYKNLPPAGRLVGICKSMESKNGPFWDLTRHTCATLRNQERLTFYNKWRCFSVFSMGFGRMFKLQQNDQVSSFAHLMDIWFFYFC